MAYSLDLRKRVLRAWDSGMTMLVGSGCNGAAIIPRKRWPGLEMFDTLRGWWAG